MKMREGSESGGELVEVSKVEIANRQVAKWSRQRADATDLAALIPLLR